MKFTSVEEKFQERVKALLDEIHVKMLNTREEWDKKKNLELAELTKSWAEKLEEREHEWIEKEKEREERAVETNKVMEEKQLKLLQDHMDRVDKLMETSKDSSFKALENRLKELEENRIGLMKEREDYEAATQEKITEALHRMQLQDEHTRKIMEEGHKQEIMALQASIAEERRLHTKTCNELESAHRKQLEVLQETVEEERREVLRSQEVFEETLRLKYDAMIKSLQDKVKAEQEAQMRRALDSLERTAKLEGERTRQEFEMQATAEAAATSKFKSLIQDLKHGWEEDEIKRAKAIEQRIKDHYDIVVSHLQTQLELALKVRDEVEVQWEEEVEGRNKLQLETMKAFEAKCRSLYVERFDTYTEKTKKMVEEYEQHLVEQGALMAQEKAKYEGKLREMRLACGQWRTEVMSNVQGKVSEAVSALEEKYSAEIENLQEEVIRTKDELQQMTKLNIEAEGATKQAMMKLEKVENNRKAVNTKIPELLNTMKKLWNGLQTPKEEQLNILINLLEKTDYSTTFQSQYDHYQSKLALQLQLTQLSTRKDFLSFRIKSLTRILTQNKSADDAKGVDNEISNLKKELENVLQDFDKFSNIYRTAYNENFVNTLETNSQLTGRSKTLSSPRNDRLATAYGQTSSNI